VERGFSLVRTGQIGLMTASDASGVVLAEDDRLAIADVPTGHVETVYGQDSGCFAVQQIRWLILTGDRRTWHGR
jgi:apolipoprotein N-acyltransferase